MRQTNVITVTGAVLIGQLLALKGYDILFFPTASRDLYMQVTKKSVIEMIENYACDHEDQISFLYYINKSDNIICLQGLY